MSLVGTRPPTVDEWEKYELHHTEGNKKVLKFLDYAAGLDGLPKSDVLKFLLEDNCSIVIRPSGTEPKLKMYISVSAEDKETAEKTEEEICRSAEEYLNVPKMDIRNPR